MNDNFPNVKHIVAVASGKGGVGKSTVAVNLALALNQRGASVGILDADIYGPSVAQALSQGVADTQTPANTQAPADSNDINDSDAQSSVNMGQVHRAHGIVYRSIAHWIDQETAVIWRGPMVTKALVQLLKGADWGELDYLVIDMPPGTGDVALTLTQRVPLSGAVVVTTPQDLALLDARRAIEMFNKVKVPTLGIVENMAMHQCSQCGHQEWVFGEGGGAVLADQYGLDLLGQIPLRSELRQAMDDGAPTVVKDSEGDLATMYLAIAEKVEAQLAKVIPVVDVV